MAGVYRQKPVIFSVGSSHNSLRGNVSSGPSVKFFEWPTRYIRDIGAPLVNSARRRREATLSPSLHHV